MSVRIRKAFGAAVLKAEAQKKKIEKRRKNFLTKAFGCVSISKLTAQAEAKTVPCKLNNVRQTKHLGQYNGLFKSMLRIEINSQRKFLSKIC